MKCFDREKLTESVVRLRQQVPRVTHLMTEPPGGRCAAVCLCGRSSARRRTYFVSDEQDCRQIREQMTRSPSSLTQTRCKTTRDRAQTFVDVN